MENSHSPVFLDVCDQSAWFGVTEHVNILQTAITVPVFEGFSKVNSTIVGFITATIPWLTFFAHNLGPTANDMVVVMNNTCGGIFSLQVSGNEVVIIGDYDAHDGRYDHFSMATRFAWDYQRDDFSYYVEETCLYEMYIYPTKSFEDQYRTNRPLIMSIAISLVFTFAVGVAWMAGRLEG